MIRRVLLLRHGRSEWNAQRRLQGHADPPLDDVGRAQAYEVAALVAALRPALIVSSDSLRAVQTAAPLGQITGLPLQLEPRLRERSFGHWEGLTREEVQERYPDEYTDWIAGRDISQRVGEARPHLVARARAVFAELPAVELAVLVTHSVTAMALCADLLGLPQHPYVLGPLANCHWSELRYEHAVSAWQLRAHNAGPPGPVIPRIDIEEDAPDAEA